MPPPSASADLHGLPVPKMRLIFDHGIKRPALTLTFDVLTSELVRNVSRGTDNLPPDSGVSVTFHCRVMSKHASK